MKSRSEKRVLEAFGKTVRRERRKLDLSQEKLAESTNFHRTYIADIERETKTPTSLTWSALPTPLGFLFPPCSRTSLSSSALDYLPKVSFSSQTRDFLPSMPLGAVYEGVTILFLVPGHISLIKHHGEPWLVRQPSACPILSRDAIQTVERVATTPFLPSLKNTQESFRIYCNLPLTSFSQ